VVLSSRENIQVRKFLASVGIGAVLSLRAATPAWAHVTVNPNAATKGGFSKLTFRVPNEEDSASTVGLEVLFPPDAPIPFVSVKAHPGWTYTTEMTKLDKPITTSDGQISEVVSKITWKGGTIGAGEFDEFDVSAGPLPMADKLTFKALQTYSNGDIVRWIETPDSDGKEPAHPAPVLNLADAPKATEGASMGMGALAGNTAPTGTASSAHTTATVDFTTVAKKSSVDDANTLAVVALVVGIVGVAIGVGGVTLRRRRTS
jgi:uncharacterized protein YcnI